MVPYLNGLDLYKNKFFLPFSILFLQKYLVISIALGIIGVTGFLWQSSQLTFGVIHKPRGQNFGYF